MIRVRYFSRNDPPGAWLDDSTRTVLLAGRYVEIDNECGAITYMDVRPGDVRRLAEFAHGDEVFVESDDASHCFDSETEDARRNTHVWWRATVVERGGG